MKRLSAHRREAALANVRRNTGDVVPSDVSATVAETSTEDCRRRARPTTHSYRAGDDLSNRRGRRRGMGQTRASTGMPRTACLAAQDVQVRHACRSSTAGNAVPVRPRGG
jgi:hypothetical protein